MYVYCVGIHTHTNTHTLANCKRGKQNKAKLNYSNNSERQTKSIYYFQNVFESSQRVFSMV